METLRQDLRFAARTLARTPRVTVLVVLTVAFGVGASTGMFSVVNAVLLRRLPFPDPGQLVVVWLRNLPQGYKEFYVSAPDFKDFTEQSRVFQQMAAYHSGNFNLTVAGETEQIQGWYVSADFFSLLGTRPLLGRAFLPGDDQPGHDPVALISESLWKRRFGSDRFLVGKALQLNDTSFTVVGIMPRGFEFPPDIGIQGGYFLKPSDVWVPLAHLQFLQGLDLTDRGSFFLTVLARLKSSATLAKAQSALETIDRRLQAQYPVSTKGWDVVVVPLEEQMVGNIRPALLILFGAVGFVLLIACGNAASLLLTKSTGRHKEIAIRAALGASPRRIVRQLLTESVVLGGASGVLGLAVAYALTPLFAALASETIPRAHEAHVDVRVLAFTAALALLTGLLMGLAPALHSCRQNLSEALTETGRGATSGPGGSRIRILLITFEVALAFVLLTGAGLMTRSFVYLEGIDPGFDRHNLVTVQLSFNPVRYPDVKQRTAFFKELLRRTRELPGVRSAGGIDALPLTGVGDWTFDIEGRPPLAPDKRPIADFHCISPGYLRTMAIPLLSGRDFTDQDERETPKVAIINQAMVRRFFPDEDPRGKRINLVDPPTAPVWRTIVGVVGDARYESLDTPPGPDIYLPYRDVISQNPTNQLRMVVRTTVGAGSMAAEVQRAAAMIDKDERVSDIKTMDERMGEALGKQRLYLILLVSFSLVALILSAVGLYGVISYNTAQRNREVGVRLALGAKPRDVVKLVLGQGLKMTAIGTGVGLLGSLALRRIMSSLLFGVARIDTTVLIGVPLLLVGVALGACYFPARRAARVDPIVALRCE